MSVSARRRRTAARARTRAGAANYIEVQVRWLPVDVRMPGNDLPVDRLLKQGSDIELVFVGLTFGELNFSD